MPFSALLISKSAACINLSNIFSTSSPTYPASVSDVASTIANGTSKILAKDWANNVFPDPAGPINAMFDFSIFISDCCVFCVLILL